MTDSQSMIRVNLVGGSTLTRDVLSHLLGEAGISVGSELPLVPEQNEIALLIAEDGEPGRLLIENPARRSIVVTDIDSNDDSVVDLVLDGADAVVGLDAPAQQLTDVVRAVAEGGTVIAPRPARRLSELARSSRGVAPERALLTSREIDILLSIGRGESVKQTATALGISAKTVENLQSRLFRKLDVRNRAQAFAQAHAMGLLPLAALDSRLDDEQTDHTQTP